MQIKELGHVVLYVRNARKSAAFYRDTLGFAQLAEGAGMAMFSSGRTHHELLLIEVGGEPTRQTPGSRPTAGLYHLGFKIGDGPQAARDTYAELKTKGVRIIGTTDHGVTHSIYIEDPDGNELELYADVDNGWKTNPAAVLAPARALNLE